MSDSSVARLRFFRGCLALASLLLVPLLTSCASPQSAATAAVAPPEPVEPKSYLRLARPDTNTVELQVAVRQLIPARKSQPVIWLAAASHIGDSSYYTALQAHLETQSLVLFEGVSEERRKERSHVPRSEPKRPPTEDSSLQGNLARSLGLVFQLDAIDYERPHFRNSDLTISEIQALMRGETLGTPPPPTTGPTITVPSNETPAPGASTEFTRLLEIMDGSSLLGAIVQSAVRWIGASPKLQALTKLAFIEILGQMDGDLAQIQALPPEFRELLSVLIHRRNDVVIDDLKSEMNAPQPAQTVGVFYGAAHMPDLEKRIRQELNYRLGKEIWLPAFSVQPKQAGLSDQEMQFVRSMVQWQLQVINAKPAPGSTP